jgi:hypothetical protein
MLPSQPNQNLFKAPSGYFEKLPQQILERQQSRAQKTKHMWLAASLTAAMVLLGVFFWDKSTMLEDNIQSNLSAEINFFINAGHWEAEDILNLSDNPNQLLDEMIANELFFIDEDFDNEEFEDIWF